MGFPRKRFQRSNYRSIKLQNKGIGNQKCGIGDPACESSFYFLINIKITIFLQKANEKDAYGNQKDRIQKLEEDNLFYTNKIKLLEDNLAKSKAEFSSTWKSLMEKEKYTKELQNDVNFFFFLI